MTNDQLMAGEIANATVQEVNDLPTLTMMLNTLDTGGPGELERLINLDMLAMFKGIATPPLFPHLRKAQRKLLEEAEVAKIQSGTLGDLFADFSAGLLGPKTTTTKTKAGDITKTTESATGFGGFIGGLVGMAAPLVLGLYGQKKELEHERDMQNDLLDAEARKDSAALAALKENQASALQQNQQLMAMLAQDTGGASTMVAVGIGVGALALVGGGAYLLLKK